ncbi:PTB domain engulfment adapter [Tasmannia lanceolata]|uniref:PTB domain engulfment adapter n=1 Tax=Tasmannia lanceolata TaxID=3420 RepID=UPI00406472F3
MASLLFPAPKSPVKGRDEVYVASMPLRATEGPAQMLMSAAYSLNLWDLQHYMVIVRPTSPQAKASVFDFQPVNPENIYVALAVLSRRRIPGVVLVRKLVKLPTSRCWFVGFSHADGIDVANKFNDYWQTDLKLGDHDCRHYTNGLVECLTGEQHILERLRSSSR